MNKKKNMKNIFKKVIIPVITFLIGTFSTLAYTIYRDNVVDKNDLIMEADRLSKERLFLEISILENTLEKGNHYKMTGDCSENCVIKDDFVIRTRVKSGTIKKYMFYNVYTNRVEVHKEMTDAAEKYIGLSPEDKLGGTPIADASPGHNHLQFFKDADNNKYLITYFGYFGINEEVELYASVLPIIKKEDYSVFDRENMILLSSSDAILGFFANEGEITSDLQNELVINLNEFAQDIKDRVTNLL